MNSITLAGHLGTDPEVRFIPSGQKVTTFSIATNSKRAGKDETTWWRISVWGERFDKMMQYLKKGSAVIVIGELRKPDIYNNREGNPQVSLEVTAEVIRFSPFGKGQQGEGQQGASAPQSGGFEKQQETTAVSMGTGPETFSSSEDSEEIPF